MFSTPFLLAVSMVAGQAEAPVSNYKHLKQIEWIIGTMAWTTEADEDVPGICKTGDKLVGKATHEWVLNKNAIAVNLSLKTVEGGVPVFSHRGMIGWHAGEEVIISGGFNSTGGYSRSVWSRDGDKWSLKGNGVLGTGVKTSSTLIVTRTGSNSCTVQEVERTEGDKSLPDGPELVLKLVGDDEEDAEDVDDDDDDDDD